MLFLRRPLTLFALAPLVLGLAVCCIALTPAPTQAKKLVIYFKKDAEGVYHFTNRRSLAKGYKVYMVFRDIMRTNPGLGRDKIIQLAKKHGKRYGIDSRLVQAVIEVESGFNAKAVSTAGAEGLMQIMPETQKDLGVRDSFDPDENVKAGVRYLKQMLDRFGQVELALAAYNAGPGRVEQYGGIPPFPETQSYVKKVLARYRRMKAGT